MSDASDFREMGPIDWLLIELDRPLTGDAAPPRIDLVERGLIRIPDISFVRKLSDGSVQAVEIADVSGEEAPFVAVRRAGHRHPRRGRHRRRRRRTGGRHEGEHARLREGLGGCVRSRRREAGGFLVDRGRIPTQAIVAPLDELEAAEQAS